MNSATPSHVEASHSDLPADPTKFDDLRALAKMVPELSSRQVLVMPPAPNAPAPSAPAPSAPAPARQLNVSAAGNACTEAGCGGTILADGGEVPGVVAAEIDPAAVARARHMIPALGHDRPYDISRRAQIR